jgi:hypothetical protein
MDISISSVIIQRVNTADSRMDRDPDNMRRTTSYPWYPRNRLSPRFINKATYPWYLIKGMPMNGE